MEVPPPAVAAVRDSQQQRIAPIPQIEWEFCGFPSGQFEVSSVKQEGPGAPRLRIGDCGLRDAGRGPTPEPKCAKRTQFGPACSVPVRALGSMGTLRAAGPRAGCACCEETPDGVTTNGARVQNEPNLARPEAADGGNCAKRSQTWRDWGIWTKAVVVRGVARPGSETCKTNPISKRSFKFEVSSVKPEESGVHPSDFKLHTCHFKLPAQRPVGRVTCKTKPIPGGAGRARAAGTRGNRAKRSQFGPGHGEVLWRN
jgi:hypothetical protein